MCTRLCLAAAALLNLLPAATFAQELPRAEIAKRAKAATALVEVAGGAKHGTAFCFHAGGFFLTNEHVIRGSKEVGIVLQPGLKGQKVTKVRVLRSDRDLDLAVLKTLDAVDVEPLGLGSSDGLVELAEVVAAGFPFGKALALSKDSYPAISVNAGRVTALRLKKGELERIQMDAVVNPGNSGGPVLDLSGKVIGVVDSGVPGATVNFAIPVSHVHRFLAVPEVELAFPVIAYADRHMPAAFQVRAVALTPSTEAFDVELILTGRESKPRSFKMKPEKGSYRVVAEAMSFKGAVPIRATLTYPSGSLQGMTTDRSIKIGAADFKLSEVRSLRFGPKMTAVLMNGKIATGALSGLDDLALDLGSDTIKLDAAKALDLTLQPQHLDTSVRYTVVVRRGDKEVARLSGDHPLSNLPTAAAPAEIAKLGIAPPTLERDAVEHMLPSTVGDVAAGGGGRFLILHFNKDKSLGIFDVSQAKIVKLLPLAEDHAFFAAGMDKLVVAYPNSGVFQRYSLDGFEREKIGKPELNGKIYSIALGSASSGPIFVGGPQGPGDEHRALVTFVDLDFNILPVQMKDKHHVGFGGPQGVRVSANGRVFAACGSYCVQSIVVDGLEARVYAGGMGAGSAMPSHDGNVLYATKGIYTWQAKELEGTAKGPRAISVPAHGYPYHLSVAEKGLAVHLAGEDRVVAALPHVDERRDGLDLWGRTNWTPDKRYHFIPDAKLIVHVAHTNDRLILHRFDMDAALAKARFDYFFVTSSPPLSVRRGEVLNYAIAVRSKHEGIAYKLVNAPPGMTLSPAGQLTWAVPPDWEGVNADVLVAIENGARQEIFHSFKIGVQR